MGLSFSQVVAANNLLALKSFSVFLFNYSFHEKPNFIERWCIKRAQAWIENRARKEFIDLKVGIDSASVGLNDCQTSLFTVLYLASQKSLTFSSGKELFDLIAQTELEFERIKKPRSDTSYSQPQQ